MQYWHAHLPGGTFTVISFWKVVIFLTLGLFTEKVGDHVWRPFCTWSISLSSIVLVCSEETQVQTSMLVIVIIIIITILLTMFMVLSSWHSHCESSPGSFDECRLSAGWPPTLRPNQPIWAVSPPKDWLLPSADTIAIYYYYSVMTRCRHRSKNQKL